MEPRPLRAADVEDAGTILHWAFSEEATRRGYAPPWSTAGEAAELVARYLAAEPEGALAAGDAGELVGVGFVRRRGDVATIGPLAVTRPGRGIGGQLLDELIARAEDWGSASIRVYQDAWNPSSFALYSGRSFSVVDVAAHLQRRSGAPPRLDAARGLEMSPLVAAQLPEVVALDRRLTGQVREADLAEHVRLVARRRGSVVGFLGSSGAALGPALALDVSDLTALISRVLGDMPGQTTRVRLSAAAPTAVAALLTLGFRVVEIGTIMSRGMSPPARPPQLYSIEPEVL